MAGLLQGHRDGRGTRSTIGNHEVRYRGKQPRDVAGCLGDLNGMRRWIE